MLAPLRVHMQTPLRGDQLHVKIRASLELQTTPLTRNSTPTRAPYYAVVCQWPQLQDPTWSSCTPAKVRWLYGLHMCAEVYLSLQRTGEKSSGGVLSFGVPESGLAFSHGPWHNVIKDSFIGGSTGICK